jgi:hypothetical protein
MHTNLHESRQRSLSFSFVKIRVNSCAFVFFLSGIQVDPHFRNKNARGTIGRGRRLFFVSRSRLTASRTGTGVARRAGRTSCAPSCASLA